MISYWFEPEDALRTRFAISPLFELTASVAALRDPARHSLHLPWVRAARARVSPHPMLDALIPPHGYVPDFTSPPPDSPLPDVATEIERVRATPPAAVRRELGWRFDAAPVPPVLRPLLDDPRRGLARLADELEAYWETALAPDWEAIRAVLEDDIAHRASVLVAGGPLEVFGDLHPEVRWRGGRLRVDRPHTVDVHLGGRGLQLVPSVFLWPSVAAMTDAPWQPALLYPPRGTGALWAPTDAAGLDELLGARRARILGLLGREHSTTALARRLDASPAGVSEHLGVLRRAGLVRARRQGREVRYARTAAGDALLRGVASAG